MRKKKKEKKFHTNQQSFFFEDYLSSNQKFKKEKNFIINEDRIYILFFSFFSLILIFSLKIVFISFQSPIYNERTNHINNFNPVRTDIVDRNGILLSRSVIAYHAAVKPNLIKDKKKLVEELNIKSFKNVEQTSFIGTLLYPCLFTEYKRQYFAHENCRITLDTSIKVYSHQFRSKVSKENYFQRDILEFKMLSSNPNIEKYIFKNHMEILSYFMLF